MFSGFSQFQACC